MANIILGDSLYEPDPNLRVECGRILSIASAELRKHSEELAANPADWMPWNLPRNPEARSPTSH